MKNNNNKKVLSIVAVLAVILVIVGIFYIKNKPKSGDNNPTAIAITATVRKASFGSVVNVSLSEAGKTQYKGAVKYQVYYEGKPVTQKEVLGTATTAFPARKENEKVTIKLLKVDDKEAYSVDLNLQKEKHRKIILR